MKGLNSSHRRSLTQEEFLAYYGGTDMQDEMPPHYYRTKFPAKQPAYPSGKVATAQLGENQQ
jgi:hypothetical protein